MIKSFDAKNGLFVKGSGIAHILKAVLKGNARANVRRGITRIYPMSSSEALNPQTVRRAK